MGLSVYYNTTNTTVVAIYFGYLFVLFVATLLFQVYRNHGLDNRYGDRGRDLEYKSPDDTPRKFTQFPLASCTLGSGIRFLWLVFLIAGYLYVVIFSCLSYNSETKNLFAGDSTKDPDIQWEYLVTAWNPIFWTTHLLAFVFILVWKALATRFMVPVVCFSKATHVLVQEDANATEEGENVSSVAEEKRRKVTCVTWVKNMKRAMLLPVHTSDDDLHKYIEFTCVIYHLNRDEGKFEPTGTYSPTPRCCHQQLNRGGHNRKEAEQNLIHCGKNEVRVEVPSILTFIAEEFIAVPYIITSIGIWCFMTITTWNVASFWLILNIGSGLYRSIFVERHGRLKICALSELHMMCEVFREGTWKTIPNDQIVLGDIIAVAEGVVPVDGLVVCGHVVVNESMLTGEPMPVQKLPVENSSAAAIAKSNVIYAGTNCMQSNGPREGKGLLIATGIGASTARGALIRMVLFPSEVAWKMDNQFNITTVICLGWCIFLVALHMTPIMDIGSLNVTLLMSGCFFAFVMPPMLPVTLTCAQVSAASRLNNDHSILCLQPARIPIAGKISLMVFDKTGTITTDGMDFHAVMPLVEGKFTEQVVFMKPDQSDDFVEMNSVKLKEYVPTPVRHSLACNHTVTSLRDGTLVGNHVECSMVKTVGWSVGEDHVSSPSQDETLTILKRLEFDHRRMTSGVVVRSSESGPIHVYVKGSYEKIAQISAKDSIPADYDKETKVLAKEGFYTLGMAHKILPPTTTVENVVDMSREELENGLGIIGLLLFRNEMKHDSPEAIEALKAGNIPSVVCTGDNALTGISIGKKCGIIDSARVLLGDVPAGKDEVEWVDPDFEHLGRVDPLMPEHADCQLALTQAAWRNLYSGSQFELSQLGERLRVFGRMKPEDKINVVTYYQSLDHIVGMCGDGGNDCGGLRAAHAGIALSEAEASLVSPFSTGRDGGSLITVVDLIREGRACLTTNLASYQYFMFYAFFFTMHRMFLNCYNAITMGEYVWLFMDVLVSGLLAWSATRARPQSTLSDYRPTGNLYGIRVISSVAVPVVLGVIMTVGSEIIIWSQDWYIRPDLLRLGVDGKYWQKRADNYDSPVLMFSLVISAVNVVYAGSYGGGFRRNVVFNIFLNVFFVVCMFTLTFLLWAPTTPFHCLFRVNCDNKRSLRAGKSLSFFKFLSSGGVGGIFYGPQLQDWQAEEIGRDASTDQKKLWVQQFEENKGRRHPPTVKDSIRQLEESTGCKGANNCYPTNVRWYLTALYVIGVLSNHFFVLIGLNGCVAEKLRKRLKGEVQLNIEETEFATIPLVA